jgi:hypothetical protein
MVQPPSSSSLYSCQALVCLPDSFVGMPSAQSKKEGIKRELSSAAVGWNSGFRVVEWVLVLRGFWPVATDWIDSESAPTVTSEPVTSMLRINELAEDEERDWKEMQDTVSKRIS